MTTPTAPYMAEGGVAKERPILFSGPMVRALLAGTKTQTRRVVKPQPAPRQGIVNAAYCRAPHLWLPDGPVDSETDPATEWQCPYGQPGDRLWVRETFVQGWPHDDTGCPAQFGEDDNELPQTTWYRATSPDLEWCTDGENKENVPWRPSIHMPRWASRILLEITEVRVERLQEISEADCVAEGMKPAQPDDEDARHQYSPKWAYEVLWDRLGGDWAANPWVWAVSFRIATPTPQTAPKD